MTTAPTESAGAVIGVIDWYGHRMADITRHTTAEGCHTTSAYGASQIRPLGTGDDVLIDDAVAVARAEGRAVGDWRDGYTGTASAT